MNRIRRNLIWELNKKKQQYCRTVSLIKVPVWSFFVWGRGGGGGIIWTLVEIH